MDDEGEDTSQDVTPLPDLKQEPIPSATEMGMPAMASGDGDAIMVMGKSRAL